MVKMTTPVYQSSTPKTQARTDAWFNDHKQGQNLMQHTYLLMHAEAGWIIQRALFSIGQFRHKEMGVF
jgi:hypothetical protein